MPVRKPTPECSCHISSRLLLVATNQRLPLLLDTLLPPLARSLGLRTLGVHLLLESPVASLLGLGLVDLRAMSVHWNAPDQAMLSRQRATYVFNESTLVLEGVTLGEVVQLVVEVLVDLSGGTVLDEKTAEDTETAHPQNLAKPNR